MRLTVAGLGLIGGSVALAARELGHDVTGYDPDAGAVATALERGALSDAADSLDGAVVGAELALVAGPVGELPSLAARALEAAPDRCVVTDVGSTKLRVVDAVREHPWFVGGHPVCGSEARGVANARADLFRGATWFLTPVPTTDPAGHRAVHGFVTSLGARPVAVDPAAHDRLVALTSHLPHALANMLVNQAGAGRIDGHDPLAATGGSFRDMTRVAGANPRIWVDIFLENRTAVLDGLREHGRRVEELAAALEREDAGYVARWIAEAAGHRRRLLETAYPVEPEQLYRLRVKLSDRPGEISGITQALGAAGINIEDFELHHVSAEAGGNAVILVAGKGEADRAVELLDQHGFAASAVAAVDA